MSSETSKDVRYLRSEIDRLKTALARRPTAKTMADMEMAYTVMNNLVVQEMRKADELKTEVVSLRRQLAILKEVVATVRA